MSDIRKHVRDWAESAIEAADQVVSEWKDTLSRSPARAIRGSDGLFWAVARREVAFSVHWAVTGDRQLTVDELGGMIRREIQRRARYNEDSTCALTNHFERKMLCAWALALEVAEELQPPTS